MVQYNTSVRGMQGVATKNDASYDLSRARASVTGQATSAAAPATTFVNGRIVTALFAGALFLSAFLLFVLEPMVTAEHPAHAWRHTDGVEHAPPWL